MAIKVPDTATFPKLAQDVIKLLDRIKHYSRIHADVAADTEQQLTDTMTRSQSASLYNMIGGWYLSSLPLIAGIRTGINTDPFFKIADPLPPEPDVDGYYVPSPHSQHRAKNKATISPLAVSTATDTVVPTMLPNIIGHGGGLFPAGPVPRAHAWPAVVWPAVPPPPVVYRPVAEEHFSNVFAYWWLIRNELFANLLFDDLRFEYWQYMSTMLFKHYFSLFRFVNEQPAADLMCKDAIVVLKQALYVKGD